MLKITVLQVTSHSYGARQNSALHNFVLLQPIITKLGVIDYVSNPYSYAILVEYGLLGNSP